MWVIKLLLVAMVILTYFIFLFPFYPFINKDSNKFRGFLNSMVSFYCKIICKILNVKIDANFKNFGQGHFIVANHLSYLDIFTLSSLVPTSYVTSIEMKQTPILGPITQLAGCLFVERRNRKKIHQEIGEVEEALRSGQNVTVFPEAKATNGESVLKFKRSLFQAAINANTDTVPLTIQYKTINDSEVSSINRDLICWYGDMPFFPHIINLCKLKKIEVSIQKASLIQKTEFECSGRLRDKAYTIIENQYESIV